MSRTDNKIHTPVSSLMTTDFAAVGPSDTLGEAVERMTEKAAGSALVVDYGRLVGILTSRDILRAVAGRTHSSEARVREWMSGDPRVALVDTPSEKAALMMVEQVATICPWWKTAVLSVWSGCGPSSLTRSNRSWTDAGP